MFGSLLEHSIAVVQEERVWSPQCRHQEIQITVAIDVGEGGPGGEAIRGRHTRQLGYVFEPPAAEVSVQHVGTIQTGEIDVYEPITVYIPQCDTRSVEEKLVPEELLFGESVCKRDAGFGRLQLTQSVFAPSGYGELGPSVAVCIVPLHRARTATAERAERDQHPPKRERYVA